MSGHGRRQQKKLARQKAKRTERKMRLARRAEAGIEALFRHAAEWPVLEALVPDNLWDVGIGQLVLARRLPDGGIAFATFLVDVYCLGVKDAFGRIESMFGYRSFLAKISQVARHSPVRPESFVKLVTGAVDFARSIGVPPHPDYDRVRAIFAGIDPNASADQFVYGKDGVPLYIQGPNESSARAAAITARVTAAGGHFLIGGPASAFDAPDLDAPDLEVLEDDEEPDDPEEIGRS